MPGSQMTSGGKPYLKIIGGKIVENSREGVTGAVQRDYELPNGQKGTKWEIPYLNWEGRIVGITFKESEYGETCNIELDDAFLQMGVEGRYFQDFACKLFSADLTKNILIHPYDMEIDGKKKTGVSLQQGGEKLKNFFYDGEKNINGFPEVDETKKSKKTYWKIYFAQVAEFLIERLKELKFETQVDQVKKEFGGEVMTKEVAEKRVLEDPTNDLPF